MAKFINPHPDVFPWKHKSEKAFAEFLESIPLGWEFWHEPRVHGGRTPDFIIFAKDTEYPALVVFELKHWGRGFVKNVTDTEVILGHHTEDNPILKLQAINKNIIEALSAHYRTCPELQDFAILVVLGFWGSKRVDIHPDLLNSEDVHVFDSEQFESSTIFANKVRDAIKHWYQQKAIEPPPCTNNLIHAVKAKVDRTTIVQSPTGAISITKHQGRAGGYSKPLENVLDDQQLSSVRSLVDGQCVLSGVAGTGKSIILLARARWWIDNHPHDNRKQLFIVNQLTLCNCLRQKYESQFAKEIGTSDNVEFKTYREWMTDTFAGARYRLASGDEQERQAEMSKIAEEVLSGRLRPLISATKQYAYIYLDEAHQLETSWIKIMLPFAHGDAQRNIWISYDNGQGIYKNRRFHGPSIGLDFRGQGHGRRFHRVYRSGLYPWMFAACCHPEALATYREQQAKEFIEFVRKGNKPKVIYADTLQAQANKLHSYIKSLIQDKQAVASDFSIFYACAGFSPDSMYPDEGVKEVLDSTFNDLGGIEWVSIYKREANWTSDKVRACAFTSSQGIDAPVSVIFGAETFTKFVSGWTDPEALFYTVLTRAKDTVILTGQNFNPKSSCHFIQALGKGIEKMKRLVKELDDLTPTYTEGAQDVFQIRWAKIDSFIRSNTINK